MAKYRKLTQEELNGLEKEFIDFLIINGITADDWEILKREQAEKASKIIEQFSDVIWEGVLRKTTFIDHISPQEVRTFQCLSDKLILMGIKIEDNSLDLRTKAGYQTLLENRPAASIYTSEKSYSNKREMEIFELIRRGAQHSNGVLFKHIALLLAEE